VSVVERREEILRECEDVYVDALVAELAAARSRVVVARDHRAKVPAGLTPAELADGARVVVAMADAADDAVRAYGRMERARIEWLRAVSS
jgi:hypothetical protein